MSGLFQKSRFSLKKFESYLNNFPSDFSFRDLKIHSDFISHNKTLNLYLLYNSSSHFTPPFYLNHLREQKKKIFLESMRKSYFRWRYRTTHSLIINHLDMMWFVGVRRRIYCLHFHWYRARIKSQDVWCWRRIYFWN